MMGQKGPFLLILINKKTEHLVLISTSHSLLFDLKFVLLPI